MPVNLTYKRHAELVDRMANALGLDLELKIMEGKLRIGTLGDAVLRCTGCVDPAACERWLETVDGVVEEAPAMCRNAELFELLNQDKHV